MPDIFTETTIYFADSNRGRFSPATVAGLKMWLAPESGFFQNTIKTIPAVINDDPVAAWVDKSGNGNDVLQATDLIRPILKTNTLNSLPTIDLDGTMYMETAIFGAALNQPNTVFIVVKMDTVDNYAAFDGLTAVRGLIDVTGVGGVWRATAGTALQGGTPNNSWHIRTVLFNGVTSENLIDGTAVVASGNAGAGAIDGVTLGAAGNLAEKLAGNIAELLVYNAAITGVDRTNIQRYLGRKYALPIV